MARETWVQSQVDSYQRLKKRYLMPPCSTLSIIRYRSRIMWSTPGKGVAPSPTPWCSSYRKGSLWVTLDYGRQLYFTYSQQNMSATRLLAFCEAPEPVLDFGPERGSAKGTMADLGPLIRHLVSTRLPSGGRAALLSPLSPMYGTRPSV